MSGLYSSAESEWQRGLGSSVPGDGNAVLLSDDETTLYVTSRDGSIHAINPLGGSLLKSIFPDALEGGWEIRGRSGIAMIDDLVVYAVIDEPPLTDFTSRVQRYVLVNKQKPKHLTLKSGHPQPSRGGDPWSYARVKMDFQSNGGRNFGNPSDL